MTRVGAVWTELGDDPCHGCGIAYALELEVRCVGCDRGTCSACVTVVHGEAWCAECHGEHACEGERTHGRGDLTGLGERTPGRARQRRGGAR